MPRYRLCIEYDGGPFAGWQRQDNGLSIQQRLEEAVAALCQAQSRVYGAGRTDAGVHALAMTAHFDSHRAFCADVIRDGLNAHLRPSPITVLQAMKAPEEFHARFSCLERQYRYRIVNRRTPLALDRGRAWAVHAPLDAAQMDQAARHLLGRHDFTTFRSAHCQSKSPIKTLTRIHVARTGCEIEIACAAPSFLHNQVRSFVGSLVEVGRGKWTGADLLSALTARDRKACGPVAPPDGLYFERAVYPGDEN